MTRETLAQLYERLEALVEKMPGPLQKPILDEMTPVKELFLRRRTPRLALAAHAAQNAAELVNALFGARIVGDAGDEAWETLQLGGRWVEAPVAQRSAIRLFRVSAVGPAERDSIAQSPPDVILALGGPGGAMPDAAALRQAWESSRARAFPGPGVIGVIQRTDPLEGELATGDDPQESRRELEHALRSDPVFGPAVAAVLVVWTHLRFRRDGSLDADADGRRHVVRLAELVGAELPNEAKLEWARLTGARRVQREIALILVRSTTAICALIGAQPVPFADLPLLNAIQIAMVTGILHVSGREATLRAAAEFFAALSLNLGAGYAFRQTARALAKLFPGWGNVVSGAVAGAGTYAIGRAATGYFIEGVTLGEVRRRAALGWGRAPEAPCAVRSGEDARRDRAGAA